MAQRVEEIVGNTWGRLELPRILKELLEEDLTESGRL